MVTTTDTPLNTRRASGFDLAPRTRRTPITMNCLAFFFGCHPIDQAYRLASVGRNSVHRGSSNNTMQAIVTIVVVNPNRSLMTPKAIGARMAPPLAME